ncbi:EamA family transporter [Rosenbergiella epipactidis]|nr:EamA family transporter [Rosenbergiella epipactidis]
MLAIGKPVEIDATVMVLAIVFGAVTSGTALIVWYSILPQLSSTTASTLKLCVPCLAAFGGVIFLSEAITLRMFISTAIIILGILLVIQSDIKTRGKSGD